MSNLATLRPYTKEHPGARHTQKHPEGYITCKFKKWIKKQIYPYHNPITNVTEIIKGVDGVALATIWAALQGDTRATDILLERLEGKVNGGINIDQSTHYHYTKINDEKLLEELQQNNIPLPDSIKTRLNSENVNAGNNPTH